MKNKKDFVYIFLHLQRSGGTAINKELNEKFGPEEEFIHVGSPWLTEKEKKERNLIEFEKRPIEKRKKAKVISGHLAYYGIHKFVPNKKPRYFTFLRNPAERLISFYQSRDWGSSKRIPSFEKWYNTRRKNEITHFYSSKFLGEKETTRIPSLLKKLHKPKSIEKIIFLVKILFKKLGYFSLNSAEQKEEFENAKKLLDSCWFVGITEDSTSALKFLSKKIGIKNFEVTRPSQSKHKINVDKKMREKIKRENLLDYHLYEYAKKLNSEQRKKFRIKN